MNITVSANDLLKFEKESKLIKAEGVLIDATDVLELVKCDANLKNQIETTINASIEEKGSVILPKEVFPLIKKDIPVVITDTQITIGSRVININLENGKYYPKITDEFNKKVFKLTDKDIKRLLEVEHAISTDLSKPILNGIRIDNNRFMAIDGYVFSERVGDFNSEIPITISNYKMLKALKGDITATCNNKYIKYQVGDYNYYDKLIEGDFIEIDKLKPRDYLTKLSVDKDSMLEVLMSMEKICSKSKNTLVTLELFENLIEVTAKNKVMEIKDLVCCSCTKYDRLKIGVNCSYFINAVKGMHKTVTMSFTTNVNPIIIESPGKYELVLPVRITSEVK